MRNDNTLRIVETMTKGTFLWKGILAVAVTATVVALLYYIWIKK